MGLPFPSPGDLPNPGIEPASLVSPPFTGGFFITRPYKRNLCSYLEEPKIRSAMHERHFQDCVLRAQMLWAPVIG